MLKKHKKVAIWQYLSLLTLLHPGNPLIFYEFVFFLKIEKPNCSLLIGNISTFFFRYFESLSVIRQKGQSQNGCYEETEHTKFSEKRTFLTPRYAHVRIWCALFCCNARFEIRSFALLLTSYGLKSLDRVFKRSPFS